MTFFVNMGRAINLGALLLKLTTKSKGKSATPVHKLPVLEKIGFASSLRTAILNPQVGNANPEILRLIQSQGHEIGLHGGKNHAGWHNFAHQWSDKTLRSELDWGIASLIAAGISPPASFASPGWNSPETLPAILSDMGFRVIADLHDTTQSPIYFDNPTEPLSHINTNLLGEPGGVGYIEYCDARKISYETMYEKLSRKLEQHNSLIMYDHPAYAAGKGFRRLMSIVEYLSNEGVVFKTISDFADCEK